MKLITVSSGSHQNGYFLAAADEILILEAGVKIKDLNRSPFFDMSKVVGCLLSHEHGDHSNYVKQYIDAGVDVYCSNGTFQCLNIDRSFVKILKNKEKIKIKSFNVLSFDTRHDAKEPIGFYINHNESGNILFATDTYYLPYNFSGVKHIIVECNYDDDILEDRIENGKIDLTLRNRVLNSHMELNNLIATLNSYNFSECMNIILVHLSSDNIDEKKAIKKIKEETGHHDVFVADKNKIIELNKTPF
jgi:phosphoribosyl 1,2-cyclic phosphodiesterase